MKNINCNEPFFVAVVHSYFGPSEKLSWLEDESGHLAEFETLEKAREAIKEYISEPYVCAHNEVGLPDLYIVDSSTKTWEEDDDGGKFDWPDDAEGSIYDSSSDQYDEDATVKKMAEMTIDYIREHAITEEG